MFACMQGVYVTSGQVMWLLYSVLNLLSERICEAIGDQPIPDPAHYFEEMLAPDREYTEADTKQFY